MDIKNKNELKRRIDLFLHDFTHEEYRINEEYCKETMRIMVDFIGHVDNRLDAADKRLKKAKAGEKALAEYIISNAHSLSLIHILMKKYRVNESEHFNLYSMHDKLKCIEIDMQEAPAHTYTCLLYTSRCV